MFIEVSDLAPFATIDAENEQLGRLTLTWPLERSDGWKICLVA